MTTKITYKEYNQILNEKDLFCYTDTDDFVNKRKNHRHCCQYCGHVFDISPGKLLKNTECPDADKHVKFIKAEIELPVFIDKETAIQNYIKELPASIKIKTVLTDLNKKSKHKCYKCKKYFRISPANFVKRNCKCLFCNK